MNDRFEALISQAQTGAGTDWISKPELLSFNEYLASRGYGVSRMEVSRAGATGRQAPEDIGYGILPAPVGDDPEHWLNHFDAMRSANYVREAVRFADADGALFDYKVWAEQP